MSTLATRSLGMRFGGLVAVDDVSLELRQGEIVGIIGPNGAGKTTFINVVSGLYFPTSGSVLFDGRDVSTTPAHKRAAMGIGRTFQLVHPFSNLSAVENIMVGNLFARKKGLRYARGRARELCQLMGLDAPERPISQLTILEIKKMQIAHALATEPKILFLDEVMAGLNVDETREVIARVQNLARQMNLAIGVVEHVMSVIRELTHRVVVLDGGRLIAEGPYEEVSKNRRVIEAYLGGEA
jgi:branched-chain amino acid transport system ATP-binding protein